jgi:hypothetical protein
MCYEYTPRAIAMRHTVAWGKGAMPKQGWGGLRVPDGVVGHDGSISQLGTCYVARWRQFEVQGACVEEGNQRSGAGGWFSPTCANSVKRASIEGYGVVVWDPPGQYPR